MRGKVLVKRWEDITSTIRSNMDSWDERDLLSTVTTLQSQIRWGWGISIQPSICYMTAEFPSLLLSPKSPFLLIYMGVLKCKRKLNNLDFFSNPLNDTTPSTHIKHFHMTDLNTPTFIHYMVNTFLRMNHLPGEHR